MEEKLLEKTYICRWMVCVEEVKGVPIGNSRINVCVYTYIRVYGRKTKGYVLLHTYSIWKMATQGITRRFFSPCSLPRAKRSVFISTRFLLFGAHDLFNTRFPDVGCIMEQKCSIFFLYEWHATTICTPLKPYTLYIYL